MAVDVGAQRLSAGLVNGRGEIALRDRVATPGRDVWPALERLIRRVAAASPSEIPRPRRCGITCEGSIDRPNGTVTPTGLREWTDFHLVERMGELTGLDVVLETWGNGRTLAERWVGGHLLPEADNMLVITASGVVDGGVIADGKLVRGRLGNGGNIGHVMVEPEGPQCPCGGQGCLNVYASSTALEAETNRPLRRVPTSIVERTGIMIGRAIASTAASFDTRLAIVGGAVPSALGTPLMDAVRAEVNVRSRLDHLADLRVEPVALGIDGPLLAAAASALRIGAAR